MRPSGMARSIALWLRDGHKVVSGVCRFRKFAPESGDFTIM
jgi:hypothetical protein